MNNKKMSFTTFGIALALLATLIYSTSANANPSDPEVYEFTITPSTVDLSSGNPTLRIRIGVRDADEVRQAWGSCEPEIPDDVSGFSYQVEYFGENAEPIEIFNDHISTSGDSFEFLVESEIRLNDGDYWVGLGTYLCKLTASDWYFNSVETSTRFTVIDSSVRTPGPSSSSPSPVSSSSPTSSSIPSATNSARPTLEEQSGAEDVNGVDASRDVTTSSPDTGLEKRESDPTLLVLITAFATALLIGFGALLWHRFGPSSKNRKK